MTELADAVTVHLRFEWFISVTEKGTVLHRNLLKIKLAFHDGGFRCRKLIPNVVLSPILYLPKALLVIF